MTLPESWAEIRQKKGNRTIVDTIIQWDGEKLSDIVEIPVPPNLGPVLIAVNNVQSEPLVLTFSHYLRIACGYAFAQIGEGENGVITITSDTPGSNDYFIEITTVEGDNRSLIVAIHPILAGQIISVCLGTDGEGLPDDTKNTAELIAEIIDNLTGFSATYSGTGETPITERIEAIQFEGGIIETWAILYDSEGNDIEVTIPGEKVRVYGPFYHFPRFLKGRITLTADFAPSAEETTTVQVREV